MKSPKVPCPMSGRRSGRFGGGFDQCEHCGKMVYIAESTGRTAKHYLSAKDSRSSIMRSGDVFTDNSPTLPSQRD